MEVAEKDEKKAEAIKNFPGLCLPDNPERAMQLLEPDSKDQRAAKNALDEVSVCVCGWVNSRYMYRRSVSHKRV